MKKKLILGLVAAVVVVGGVAGMSAWEAHVINVTAKIENALGVSTESIDFGTVFPQEYVERGFTVRLSQSFLDEDQLRRGDVYYKIVQKEKCECDAWDPEKTQEENELACPDGRYLPVDYATDVCPTDYTAMPDLCEFLSKIPDPETGDVGVPSYFSDANGCSIPSPEIATGYLVKCHPAHVTCVPGDIEDCWKVDLKVPPVAGSVGQDWPANCADWTVPTDGAVYGCDLWVEVTSLSDLEEPPAEPRCDDGWITGGEECDSGIGCEADEYCEDDCMCYPKGT